ncbi:hypothetical protein chiPu_0027190, partial [Chiloscyllium punctatum]|nr:hypothetical protein [Chiloscyllium punctatum]
FYNGCKRFGATCTHANYSGSETTLKGLCILGMLFFILKRSRRKQCIAERDMTEVRLMLATKSKI